ncbi:Formyltetrahydrofolate deformylase [Cynara cardunculus var. scolymus]|uniref:Formyltetrahydrofolate deformylase n=1 Tax=Cynara cardunculus var. scolymus TaxID=59895 RepID=A0A103XRJ7_CYNCS|nr:Formyltetrahydrofolate deformylase [Cynara cardunculus var. scolymus]
MNILRRASSSSPIVIASMKRPFNTLRISAELPGNPSPTLAHGIHVFHCPFIDFFFVSMSLYGTFIPLLEAMKIESIWEINSGDEVGNEFVFDPIKWQRKQMNNDFLDLSKMFNAVKSLVRVPSVDPKYKIAVLASKQDHCLVDLLHAWQDGKLPVHIRSVISNHDRVPNTHVIRFLERHDIPYHYLSKSKEKNIEDEILDLVQDTDFLVLARYMQVLSGTFLKRYGKDVINIHHGLLPSFKGGNPSRQAFEAGVKLIGATSHFVTEELDGGPIIEQMVERVSHKDNLLSFIQKSENLEKQCLLKAIKSYCELRVLPYEENRTVVF